jgi:HEAT repeat protein
VHAAAVPGHNAPPLLSGHDPHLTRMGHRFTTLALVLALAVGCTDPTTEVPKLMAGLRSSDTKTRSQAALGLGRIGSPHADRAVPTLVILLDDENAGVRSAAAYALRNIGGAEAERALDRNRTWGKR